MNLNEPNAALRVMIVQLADDVGGLLASDHVFAATDLKIRRPDGTIADVTTPPVMLTGLAIAGFAKFQLSQAETDQRGTNLLLLHGTGLADRAWTDEVTLLDEIIEGAVTHVQALRAIARMNVWSKRTGYRTGTVTVRDKADTKDVMAIADTPDGWVSITLTDLD